MSFYSLYGWTYSQKPYLPADYIIKEPGTGIEDDARVVYAVRALHNGTATDSQQKLVWDWLMYLGMDEDVSYRPGGEDGRRDTDFAEGRRFVSQQIKKMLDPAMTPKPKLPTTERGKR